MEPPAVGSVRNSGSGIWAAAMAGSATKRTVANLVGDINAIISRRDAIHSTSMRCSLILCLAACACLSAQVRYSADQHAGIGELVNAGVAVLRIVRLIAQRRVAEDRNLAEAIVARI